MNKWFCMSMINYIDTYIGLSIFLIKYFAAECTNDFLPFDSICFLCIVNKS